GFSGHSTTEYKHNIAREEREHGLDPTSVESIEASAHKLHVLQRHRLRLEAEVSEGALAVPVEDEPCYLAVADVEKTGSGRRDGSRAPARVSIRACSCE